MVEYRRYLKRNNSEKICWNQTPQTVERFGAMYVYAQSRWQTSYVARIRAQYVWVSSHNWIGLAIGTAQPN